eukprot:5345885-Prymnesium_polylepis.1
MWASCSAASQGNCCICATDACESTCARPELNPLHRFAVCGLCGGSAAVRATRSFSDAARTSIAQLLAEQLRVQRVRDFVLREA